MKKYKTWDLYQLILYTSMNRFLKEGKGNLDLSSTVHLSAFGFKQDFALNGEITK